jgi:hypothetical protein
MVDAGKAQVFEGQALEAQERGLRRHPALPDLHQQSFDVEGIHGIIKFAPTSVFVCLKAR